MKKISEEKRKEIIAFIENNQPEFYWDYNDELSSEQIAKILKGGDDAFEVSNEIYENNIDTVFQYEIDLMKEVASKFDLIGEDEDEDDVANELRDEFLDYISVDVNIEDLIGKSWTYITMRTGLMVEETDFSRIEYSDVESALDFLNINPLTFAKLIISGHGYSAWGDSLKDKDISEFIDIPERDGNEVVKPEDFVVEIANSSYGGEIVFLMDFNIKDFYQNLDDYKNKFILKKGAEGTIHNYGVGACGVGFTTQKDLIIDPKEIEISFSVDEESRYGVQETAGLTRSAWSSKIQKIENTMRKGGNFKQIKPQYGHENYGGGDKQKKAKPVGYRYIRIEDKKTGRLRMVTKDDREYYIRPSAKLIKAYEDKDNPMHKKARKMLYFERRKDHSDAEGRKMSTGGSLQSLTTKELAEKAGMTMSEVNRFGYDRDDLIAMITEGNYASGGGIKQIAPQYGHKKYGSGDVQKRAKPVGYRYRKIRDSKTGRIRPVTKEDKQYYQTPSQRLIRDYEKGDKTARKMLYFERRTDHSDREPLKSLKKFSAGGSVTIENRKAKYQVKYKLDGEKEKVGYIVEVLTPSEHAVDYYLLYDKSKKLVKKLSLQEAQQLVNDKKIIRTKTYDVPKERTETDAEKSVKDMDYSERRNWIQDHIIPHLKSASLVWNSYGGDSYDYNDEKESERFLKEARQEADYENEDEFNKTSGFKIDESGWGIVTKDGEDLEEVASDNTYNWSYLGLITWNFRVYKADDERYFLIAHPHRGGDVRVNYGDPIIFEGDSEEGVLYDFREKVINGGRTVYLEFKDKSELNFDAQQDSDVNYFELVDRGQKLKLNSPAELVVSTFETFDRWHGDDFLVAIVYEFEREHPKKKKKKEYGGEYSNGGGVEVREPELLLDSHHGIYIPKMFYDEFDFSKFGLDKSNFPELSDPENEGYWDAWDDILRDAETADGKILYQHEGYLFLVDKDYNFDNMFRKGGRMKSLRQKREQYHDRDVEKYGSRDGAVKARPVGYRYRKVRKNGRLRAVTKDDKEYYGSVTKKDIKLYEEGNKDARRRIYFENRKDHSDKNPSANRGY